MSFPKLCVLASWRRSKLFGVGCGIYNEASQLRRTKHLYLYICRLQRNLDSSEDRQLFSEQRGKSSQYSCGKAFIPVFTGMPREGKSKSLKQKGREVFNMAFSNDPF